MRPWMRRGAAALAALAGLSALAVAAGALNAGPRAERRIELPPYPLVLRDDAAAVERGRYLYASRGCADCHGMDGAGRVFAEADGLRLAGPDISPGAGGVVAAYTPADWERTLRHGVKPNGRPLRVMPSQDYNRLTDADLAAVVAYVRQLPPASGPNSGAAELTLPLPARVMYGWGLIPDAADLIDHQRPPSLPVAEAVTAEHGAYVAQSCIGCHGAALEGGRIPGAPPDWPAAARLAPGEGNAMAAYPDAASLRRMFDTGQRADGTPVRVMPFEALRAMNDTDVQALHLYLTAMAAARPD
jgi:mono/diheme cytochrome c family protein